MAKKSVKPVSKLATSRPTAKARSVRKVRAEGKDILVVPRGGAWAVRIRGASRAARIFKTRDEAIKRAKETAARYETSVFVFGEDGRVRAHDTSTASVQV